MVLAIRTKDRRQQTIEEIRRLKSDQVYIWGAGAYSGTIRDFLRQHWKDIGHICTIVDDEYYRPGDSDTIPFSRFLAAGDYTAPIVFGFYNYKIIQEKKKTWGSTLPHLYDFHLTVVNGQRLEWDGSMAKKREADYRQTFERLCDERSRKVMQLYLNAATTGEFHRLFTECYEEPAYFNRITKGLNISTLIDCGAYDGDSIHDFAAEFPEYQSIVAVEPDPQNLTKLREREKREGIRGVQAVQKGLGSSETILHFRAAGKSNSYLDEDGEIEVQITTLDQLASEYAGAMESGTVFLKMDIEGAELDALQGAKELIQERHPVLAICVYHKETDLIDIPRFIYDLVGDDVYEYHLGFHGLDLAELVFYAIPKS